ncbi:MAG: stage V sporulation protein AB [Clostridiales bacterium]|nr:stage V sporulation protein AB [Clostridiales bacterium]
MLILKIAACVIFGFGSGAVISGAVFAFIAVIGVIPRIADKTGTSKHIHIYEEAVVFGGILGALEGFFEFSIPLPKVAGMLISFCIGVFYGCFAVSLAEVINVIPILTRRLRIEKGLFFFILAIALGKLMGSLLYYVIPGFFTQD